MNEADSEFPQQKVQPLSRTSEELLDDEIDLLDYVEVIVRRRWMIFGATILVVLGVFVYNKPRQVTYVAETIFLPSEERNFELGSADGAQLVQARGKVLETLKGLTVGRAIIERVVPYIRDGRRDSVRLSEYFGSRNAKQALDALIACSKFRQDESGVITITVSQRDSILAAAIANAYVDELQLFYTHSLQRKAQEDLDFIKDRLAQVERELNVAEDSLLFFMDRNVIIPENSSLAVRVSRLQRLVDVRSSVYNNLVNEYEMNRIKSQREAPSFEVLSRARSIDAVSQSPKSWVILSVAVGLLFSVFLAFILEYIQKTRKSGRLDPIVKELQRDVDRLKRLLGKGEA